MILNKPPLSECYDDILYFFDFYKIGDIDDMLWTISHYALSCEELDGCDCRKRSDILLFQRLLSKLIIGLYVTLEPTEEDEK